MSGSVLIVSCEQASDRSRVKSKASLTLRRFFAVARYSPVRDLAPAFDWRQSAPKNSCEGPRNYFLEFFW
ncbi:MAG: hypothetical protein JGK29_00505 [Microcoleus sp. PH2017_17_BER_D_A]|nr:hypothetical protein [Microcoleus sp. PH2017_17_BER_D_A]TAG55692.1 MAG: hypothetical protein EAZ28_21845 [Oscillatoriales cyanobacterium]